MKEEGSQGALEGLLHGPNATFALSSFKQKYSANTDFDLYLPVKIKKWNFVLIVFLYKGKEG